MKKIIVSVLLVCFCVLCLSACSPSKDPKKYFSDEEIAALDKDVRYYHRTDAQLAQFAAWKPAFEKK